MDEHKQQQLQLQQVELEEREVDTKVACCRGDGKDYMVLAR